MEEEVIYEANSTRLPDGSRVRNRLNNGQGPSHNGHGWQYQGGGRRGRGAFVAGGGGRGRNEGWREGGRGGRGGIGNLNIGNTNNVEENRHIPVANLNGNGDANKDKELEDGEIARTEDGE